MGAQLRMIPYKKPTKTINLLLNEWDGITSSDVDEIFAARTIDLDVALTKMMFVTTKGKSSLFAVLEPHQCLPVTSTLLGQAQRHSASAQSIF